MQPEIVTPNKTVTDNELRALLKQIDEGEQSALMMLYDKTHRLVFGIVLKILDDKAAAEETLLDTYTQVWTQVGSYDPGLYGPLEWLTTIARDRAIAKLHLSQRDKRRTPASAAGLDSPATVAPEQQKKARSALGSLLAAQQEILQWAYYTGLSYGEIAARMGKPTGAVKTHTRLALTKLEGLLHTSSEKNSYTSGKS